MDTKNGARKKADMTGEDAPPEMTLQPAVQPQIQDHIGRQLRAIYEDLLSQPVPDRFTELLARLDRAPEDEK